MNGKAVTPRLFRAVERARYRRFAGEFDRLDRKVQALKLAERWTGKECPPRLSAFVDRYRAPVREGLAHVRRLDSLEGGDLGIAWLPILFGASLLALLFADRFLSAWTTGAGGLTKEAEARGHEAELAILSKIENADPDTRRMMVGALQELRRPISAPSPFAELTTLLLVGGGILAGLWLLKSAGGGRRRVEAIE